MSDRVKSSIAPTPKALKSKHSSASATPSSSRTRIPQTVNEKRTSKSATSRNKPTKNKSNDAELKQITIPEFDEKQRRIAYEKYLNAMLEDCFVDDKIEREETQMDIQMGLLAERFKKTIEQLDKTNRRVKEISFASEQKRLHNLLSHDDDQFSTSDKSKTEEAAINNLQTNKLDFGFNEESGHQQLLDVVNDAIEGLEQIKNNSKIDIEKFKQYHDSEVNINKIVSERSHRNGLDRDFDKKIVDFNERLISEATEKFAKAIMDDDDYSDG